MSLKASDILQAITDGHNKHSEALNQFEEKLEIKIKAIDNAMNLRMDAQRDKLRDIEKKVEELVEHVGFIRVLCAFAKIFKK